MNQHYVPRTYLKRFGFSKGSEEYVHALPKNKPDEKSIFTPNIKGICSENDFYNLTPEIASDKLLLETFYGKEIEHHYDDIYKILEDDKKTTISQSERDLIITTVVTMMYRTASWIEKFKEYRNRKYSYLYQMCIAQGQDSFDYGGKKISIKGKGVDEFVKETQSEIQPSQVIQQLRIALNLIDRRKKQDDIMVLKLSDEKAEFITSDNPVSYANLEGNFGAAHPSNILKLPLNSKQILCLMPTENENNRLVVKRYLLSGSQCSIEKVCSNHDQWQNATKFVIGNDTSLKQSLKDKSIAEKPLSAEEIKELSGFEKLLAKAKELGILT